MATLAVGGRDASNPAHGMRVTATMRTWHAHVPFIHHFAAVVEHSQIKNAT
jgi:hypothetical protein